MLRLIDKYIANGMLVPFKYFVGDTVRTATFANAFITRIDIDITTGGNGGIYAGGKGVYYIQPDGDYSWNIRLSNHSSKIYNQEYLFRTVRMVLIETENEIFK